MPDLFISSRRVVLLPFLAVAVLLCQPSSDAFRALQPAAFHIIYPTNLTNNRPRLFFGLSQRLAGIDPTNKVWPFPPAQYINYRGLRTIWDLLATTNIAVDKINAEGIFFPNHTLSYVLYDPAGDSTTQMQSFLMMVDSAHTTTPTVEYIMGLVEPPQTVVAAGLGKIFNVPVNTEWVQSSSLIDSNLVTPQSYPPLTIALPGTPEYSMIAYPTFSRSAFSNDINGVAVAKIISDVFQWKEYALLYNENDPASTSQCLAASNYLASRGAKETITVVVRFPALDVRFNATSGQLYNYVDPSFNPTMDAALLRIKALENLRVILYCGAWYDADAILPRAIALNMIGKHTRFLWVGSTDWSFDGTITRRYAPYLNGLIGARRRFPVNNQGAQDFLADWTAAYQADPKTTFYIPAPDYTPSVTPRYDAITFTAKLLSKANRAFDYCNTTMPGIIAAAPPVVDLANNLTGCIQMVQAQTGLLSLPSPAAEFLPLCCVLEQAWVPNPRGSVILQLLRNLTHSGISTNISFTTRGEAMGDGIVYLWNNATLDEPLEFGEFGLANGTAPSAYYTADLTLFRWPDGTHNSPRDTVERIQHRKVPSDGATGFVLAWCAASVVGLVVLVWYVERNKVHDTMRHNLRLNHLIILGCLMLVVGGILYITRNFIDDATTFRNFCSAAIWIQSCGTTIIFASIAMRTFRLYRIMYKPTDPSTGNLHDSQLLKYVFVLLLGAVVIMLAWTLVAPFELEITRIIRGDSVDLPVTATFVPVVVDTVVYECANSNHFLFSLIFYLYYAAIMWIAVFHSVSLRKKWYEYDDTFESVVSVFTSIIFSIIILAIGSASSNSEVDVLAIVLGWLPVLSADIIVAACFFRPIRSILRGESRARGAPLVRNGSSLPIASSSPIPLAAIGLSPSPAPLPQQPSDHLMLV